ncbi:ABC transporter permease [Streptomyces stramineus]
MIAGDRERGTVKLVTTQSVTRRRWLAAKIGITVLITVVCTALLGAVFTWWWEPVHELADSGHWSESPIFDTTGPMLVAKSLLFLSVGIAFGVLVRRTVTAMVLTFGSCFALDLVWDSLRLRFHDFRTLTVPVRDLGEPGPVLPRGAVRYDSWTVDAKGGLHGFGTCFNERTAEGCRTNKGIVADRLDYFGYDQLPAMQWTSAAIFLLLTVAILALTLWWAGRRAL